MDTLGEIAFGQGAAGLRKNGERVGDAAGGHDADEDAGQHGGEREQARVALHLVHVAISFALRLLYDYGPVERSDGTVSAEHVDAIFARDDGEVFGCGERLVAAIDEIADNFKIFHVLAGGEFRSGGGDETALRVDDVGSEASADFLQAADEELEIDDSGDHPQEAVAVFHGSADDEDGAGRFAFADDEGLSVVDAAVAGGGVGALEFTIEKSVGSDASGADAFGPGVEQRGVGNLVGGGDKVFEKSAEFGSLNILLADIAAAGDLDRGREVGKHDAQGALVLRDIVSQGARDGVLQKLFVGLEEVAVAGFHLRGIEVHRDRADHEEHTEDYIQDRDASVIGDARGQVYPCDRAACAGRSGRRDVRYL